MKANELAYSDYVIGNYGEDRIVQVRSVTRKKIGFHMTENETRMYYCQLCRVKPISLTEEILKANGFDHNGNKLSYYVKDGDWVFTIREIGGMLAISLADDYAVLAYVHELQHTLRLCGLNDLADNFKIK